MAHHAVIGTIKFGVASWRHESLHYQRSELEGKWPRLKYAVTRTFWVPRTNGPGNTVATGLIAGNFGGALISRAWHPVANRTAAQVMGGGFYGLGVETGVNVVREFWPWKRFRP